MCHYVYFWAIFCLFCTLNLARPLSPNSDYAEYLNSEFKYSKYKIHVTENSLLNYCTVLCGCNLPCVVVFVIVIVLYKYVRFDLRATVGCFVASNLASLPQRLFLNVHVWDSRYVKTYPSHSACEPSDPGGVRVSLMSSFKSICW